MQKKRDEKQAKKESEKEKTKEKKAKAKESESEEAGEESDKKEDQKEEKKEAKVKGHLGEDNKFLGWKKTAISIIKAKGEKMKKKKLLKKLWKVYTKSKDYSELSLD